MEAIQDFFEEKVKLPSPPAVALKILNAVQNDDNCFDELADIIVADPALTARILKIANSSLYGLSKQVESISQATALIGTQTLKNIALSFVFVTKFQKIDITGFDLDLFWRRSISAAVAAEIIAARIGCRDTDIFVSALLKDLGVLILFLSDPASYTNVIDSKRISGKTTCHVEKEIFGFSHPEVGSHLLQSWNLSEAIYGPIFWHHTKKPDAPHRTSAQVLFFADKISAMYHGTKSNKKSKEVHEWFMEEHGLSTDEVDELIDTIGEKACEVMDLFSIDPGNMKPFSLIIQEANEELQRLNLSYEQVVLELKQAKQNAEALAIGLKEANNKLRELAIRDELTGLHNHRYFQEQLELEITRCGRYKHPLSLLLLDLDFFKKVNDTYGHPAGDHVLREVGKALSSLVRVNDTVARYGGEEFAIILPETATSGGKVLAQRVRRGVEQLQISFAKQSIPITVSIGLACTDMTAEGMGRTELISKSDQALYKAKHEGRNRVAF
ncbi:MAG: diguanylate cyclase [Desulfocapsaceae bacterium]|jgi:diguanylate cyclase (GGDEF)-like protein|nr:diguanylate cyclase [Desulfocapsaceae bacterium]